MQIYNKIVIITFIAIFNVKASSIEPKNIGDYYDQMRHYAEQGDVDAQYFLAYPCFQGVMLERDDNVTAYWAKAAAEQGHMYAQNLLGMLYTEGRGVDADPVCARHWYHAAAAQGLIAAKYNLALDYYARGSNNALRTDEKSSTYTDYDDAAALLMEVFHYQKSCPMPVMPFMCEFLRAYFCVRPDSIGDGLPSRHADYGRYISTAEQALAELTPTPHQEMHDAADVKTVYAHFRAQCVKRRDALEAVARAMRQPGVMITCIQPVRLFAGSTTTHDPAIAHDKYRLHDVSCESGSYYCVGDRAYEAFKTLFYGGVGYCEAFDNAQGLLMKKLTSSGASPLKKKLGCLNRVVTAGYIQKHMFYSCVSHVQDPRAHATRCMFANLMHLDEQLRKATNALLTVASRPMLEARNHLFIQENIGWIHDSQG